MKLTKKTLIFAMFGTMLTTVNVSHAGTKTDPNPQTVQATTYECRDFEATVSGFKVKLEWNTTQEANLIEYWVQYSTDGINFTTFDVVPAVGNKVLNKYQSEHDASTVAARRVYYRLIANYSNRQRVQVCDVITVTF